MFSTRAKSSSLRSMPMRCSLAQEKVPMGVPVMACRLRSALRNAVAHGARKFAVEQQELDDALRRDAAVALAVHFESR